MNKWKEKFSNIYNDYKEEALDLWNGFKEKVFLLKEQIKNDFNDPKLRKNYAIYASVLLVITLLFANLFISFAYYTNEAEFILIRAKVSEKYASNYDYTLQVYLENAANDGQYHLGKQIPAFGYTYSGYKCQNKSTLVYNEAMKSTSVDLAQQDVCSIYFDLKAAVDLVINVKLEENAGSNTYKDGKQIPVYGYQYSHYDCDNGGELTYNSSLHSVSLTSSGKNSCNLYFKKAKADVTMRLFVENTAGQGDYIERLTIPANRTYHLNSLKTSCQNANGGRVDKDIYYRNGYIETSSEEIVSCKIYLDLDNA